MRTILTRTIAGLILSLAMWALVGAELEALPGPAMPTVHPLTAMKELSQVGCYLTGMPQPLK